MGKGRGTSAIACCNWKPAGAQPGGGLFHCSCSSLCFFCLGVPMLSITAVIVVRKLFCTMIQMATGAHQASVLIALPIASCRLAQVTLRVLAPHRRWWKTTSGVLYAKRVSSQCHCHEGLCIGRVIPAAMHLASAQDD